MYTQACWHTASCTPGAHTTAHSRCQRFLCTAFQSTFTATLVPKTKRASYTSQPDGLEPSPANVEPTFW